MHGFASNTTPEVPVRSLATQHELTVDDVIRQVVTIQQVMAKAMTEGEHYGVIPGMPAGTKPSLLKAGGEKLCLLFRLDPEYEIVEKIVDGPHIAITSRCTLYHIPTSNRMGSGMGSCSTKESKYLYREAKRKCPKCGEETIFRSKYPPKDNPEGEPGWYCHQKAGGCGRQFAAGDGAILNQKTGRIQNPDLADIHNTILKMSNKRAMIAAVLNVTAASDIFTQDLEDYPMANDKPAGSDAVVKTLAPNVIRDAEARRAEILQDVETQLENEEADPAEWGAENPATRKPAPFKEWNEALATARTPKGLIAVWAGCTQPEVQKQWTAEQRAQLTATKNASKIRLGIA